MAQDEPTEGSPPDASADEEAAAAGRTGVSSEQTDPFVGSTIDQYRVVRLIGRGGMGAVYEGLNTRIQKRVALKFIDARLAGSPDAVQRFQREAQAASAVESPNIVQIFDAGTTADGVAYLVMELLPGRDLGCHLRAVGRLDLDAALQLTAQILKALHQAHQAGIVHRDLKPDNVFLVEREGEVAVIKLLDFGVSKITERDGVPLETLTKEGTVVGTPHYMSPEQAQGLADVGAAADLYSVGAILFECLTGRTPHVGRSYEQIIVRICTQDADDVRELAPDIPEPVATVLARALSRHRSQRFRSAAEMLDALIEASPDSLRDRMQSGVFSLAPSAAGSGRGARSTGGGLGGSTPGGLGRLLTPTEAAAVGSASTVAAPIVASGRPPSAEPTPREGGAQMAARRPDGEGEVRATGSPASSTGERTAPPSTLPTFQPSARRRARRLLAVVLLGLVGGVGATLFAFGRVTVSIDTGAGHGGEAAADPTGALSSDAAPPAPTSVSSPPTALGADAASESASAERSDPSADRPPSTPQASLPGPPRTGTAQTAAATVAPSSAPTTPPPPTSPVTATPQSTGIELWRDPSLPPGAGAP